MMGFNTGWSAMMSNGYGGFSFITWLVVTVDLVLLGIWLWQRIKK